MRKFLITLLFLFGVSAPVFAQSPQITTQMTTTTTATGTGVAVPTTGYHMITWTLAGPAPTACTVAVDSSADNSSWTAGGAIPGQTCTSGGQSAVVNLSTGYIRINVTAFTGSGTLKVFYLGTSGIAGSSTTSTVSIGAPAGTCAQGALDTDKNTGAVYSCNNGTWVINAALPTGCTSPGTGAIACATASTSVVGFKEDCVVGISGDCFQIDINGVKQWWIDSSGNMNFLGTQLDLGSPTATTAALLDVHGGNTPSLPGNIRLLSNADTLSSYLGMSASPGQAQMAGSLNTTDTVANYLLKAPNANAQVGATYTLVCADFGKTLTLTNAGAIAVTFPTAGAACSSGSSTFGSGFFVDVSVLQTSVGSATITPTTGTIAGGATLVLAPSTSARLEVDATSDWKVLFRSPTNTLPVAEAAAIVANTIPKATNSTGSLITASSMIDNGTNVTSTDTGGFVAPVFTSNGTTAGFVDYPQGSTSAAVAPCNTANSACRQAPAAVTAYVLNIAPAAPVNNNSAEIFSNANPGVGSFAKMPQTAFLTSDYTNATTGFTSLTNLAFSVEANTNYHMHCNLIWSASAVTAGPQYQITGPASPTAVVIQMDSAITATTAGAAAVTAFSSAMNPVGAVVVSATNEYSVVDMDLRNGANAGTVQVQAAAQGTGTLTVRNASGCQLQ